MVTSNNIIDTVFPMLLPYVKIGLYVFIALVVVVVLVIVIIEKRKRKWRIEIHEMRADGKLHSTGRDTLVERKLQMGRKTVYWLKKAKCEVIPPPDDCVDRHGSKDEVDYLRVERDFVPVTKTVKTDYRNPIIKKKLINVHDTILETVRSVKTTFFDSDPVRNRFIYIPINKTLTANMNFKPIDYDVSMMAMNEIHNADEFYESKYEFWKKYGAIIVFAVTIVFLIILAVLTFEYIKDVTSLIMGRVTESAGLIQGLVDKVGGGSAPPS